MEHDDRTAIIACENDLLRAQRTNDVDLLDRLLHDDLLFNGPSGAAATKAQDLANYRSGGIHLRTVEASDRQISLIGDNAVVAVTVLLQGNYMGQALDARYRYLRVWKRAGAQWQVIGGAVMPLS
ncbi:MAG TPA: nuclear transport factor 2 family protein [Flavobacteriales bacterium]|jgi:ketosteroid isomerase-like protein|nr:nuclear transport factor 2 family protein [Flavobacteriales bacterium]